MYSYRCILLYIKNKNMIKEIVSSNTKHNAKIGALTMAAFALIFSAIGAIFLLAAILTQSSEIFAIAIMYLFMPVIYFVFSYVSLGFISWMYNKIARRYGGLKFGFKDHHEK